MTEWPFQRKHSRNHLPTSNSPSNNEIMNATTVQDKKKMEGIFRSILAHSISKRAVELLQVESDENISLAHTASQALATWILRGKDETKDDGRLGEDLHKTSHWDGIVNKGNEYVVRKDTRGGVAHELLFPLVKSQCKWYLTGEYTKVKNETSYNQGATSASSNVNKSVALAVTPPALPQLLNVTNNFIPSSTMFHGIHPTVKWVPQIIEKPIAKSIVATSPLLQNSLDEAMKYNLDWFLLDSSFRTWVKNSTLGYIEQKTHT